jgi:hypothetical protein
MMDRSFAFHSREKRLELVQQRLRQHHVDVQRLWKRIPQGPDHYGRSQSSLQVPIEFDEPGTGAGDGGGSIGFPNTRGTRRCSQGLYYYEQSRYAGRGRSLPFLRSTKPWETPNAVAGPYNSIGATCAIKMNVDRSQLLLADQFGFQIPDDATIYGIVCRSRWKTEWLNHDGYTGTNFIADNPAHVRIITENELGLEDQQGFIFGPWFHLGGVKIGGYGGVSGGALFPAPIGGNQFSYLDKWRGDPEVYPNESPDFLGSGFYFSIGLPGYGGNNQYLYPGMEFPTPSVVNSSLFGVSLALSGFNVFAGTNQLMRISLDGFRITLSYFVYHQTGSCSIEDE